jgi:hypothetical protein
MSQSVSVLVLDDGELDDVQKLLESLNIPFARIRGASIVPGMTPPSHLLIATPRRIEAVTSVRDPSSGESEPLRIMIAREDSNALRARLRSVGFDFLVRRPVHPEALRLLILHAMYAGEERRLEPRVTVGFEVTYKSGLIPRQGILADLSMRGCRLLSSRPVDSGKRIKVLIPEALGASELLTLRGRVIRSLIQNDTDTAGLYSLAVLFEALSNDDRNELEWVFEALSKGPPRIDEGQKLGSPESPPADDAGIRELPARNLRTDPRFEANPLELPAVEVRRGPAPEEEKRIEDFSVSELPAIETLFAELSETDSDATTASTLQAVKPTDETDDRRRERRSAFGAKVPAFGSRALRVLVGRDLSVGGMRVEQNSAISCGDRFHLAIYGEPGEEPMLVWATVARDDGDRGLAIAFDELDGSIATRLERLVTSLPAVESLHDSEVEAMGTVITEMLPED